MRTVAAISTPYGKGGVALIRVTGDDAISVAEKVAKRMGGTPLSDTPAGQAVRVTFEDGGVPFDDGLVTVFRAPRSFTGEDVAELCFVSREHLSRIFKKETGFGFNEYLNLFRLKKANAILTQNPKSRVSRVAVRCGFSDSNYFSKQYKKMYGIAPTKSRRGG